MIDLRLPWPPSVNTYYRHVGSKVLISKAGRKYRKRVAEEVFCQVASGGLPARVPGRVSVEILATPPDRRVRDLDNTLKATLDSLQAAGVIENDCLIDRLVIERRPHQSPGHVQVRVEEVREQ